MLGATMRRVPRIRGRSGAMARARTVSTGLLAARCRPVHAFAVE